MKVKSWTPEETKILMEQWPSIKDTRDLVLLIDRSYIAIRSRAKFLKLFRTAPLATNGRTKATAEQDQYIKDKYLELPLSQIARDIGYSETFVKGRYTRLGLIVPEELKEKFRQNSLLKPGNVPPNKGKRWEDYMSEEGMQNSRKTHYKKGEIPPNKAHYRDGDITVRLHKRTNTLYKWIRVSLRIWKMLHVVNWEKVHGPVPEGYIVVFKNSKNTMDCAVEKLELITMKENMLRNSASMNLSDGYIANCIAWRDKEGAQEVRQHPELIELKRQQLILNRTIHEQTSIS